MGPMTAYEVANRVAEDCGWAYSPQPFDRQARLMVLGERRWLGVTAGVGDLVLLHAGFIRPDGSPADPVAQTSGQSTDMEGLLREVGHLWQRLDAAGPGGCS